MKRVLSLIMIGSLLLSFAVPSVLAAENEAVEDVPVLTDSVAAPAEDAPSSAPAEAVSSPAQEAHEGAEIDFQFAEAFFHTANQRIREELKDDEPAPAELSADRSAVLNYLCQTTMSNGNYSNGTYYLVTYSSSSGGYMFCYTPGDTFSVFAQNVASSATVTTIVSIDPTSAYSSVFHATSQIAASSGSYTYTGVLTNMSRSAFSNSTTSLSFSYDGPSSTYSTFNDIFISCIGECLSVLDILLHASANNYCVKDLGFTSYTAKDCTGQTAAVTGIYLDRSSLSLSENGSYYLTATLTPSGASATVSWSSSNTSVATVSSSGLVTGVSAGTATIYARASGYSATCQVTVNHVHNYVYHEAIEATCTQPGWHAYNTCTGCSYSTYSEIPATGHSWNSGIVTTAASCTTSGVKTYTCAYCGGTKTEAIAALGHSFLIYASDRNATCIKDGTKSSYCDRCGLKDTVTDVGSHYNAEHTPDGNTDCTKQTKCILCGTVIKSAGKHVWDSGKISQEATCTQAGVMTYNCTVCGATESESVPATGHSWNAGRITTAPTCTTAGVKTYSCTQCGTARTESIAALGHDLVHHNGKAATCTTLGWTAYDTCNSCDYTTYQEIPATGHKWDDGTVTVEASCTESGKKVCTCTACGEIRQEELAALGHSWSSTKLVLEEATYSTSGRKAYVCSRCGALKDEESIPKLVATIAAANAKGRPGKTVDVKLTVKDNPGIMGAVLQLAYADGLTLQKITVGDAWKGLTFTKPGDLTANPITLLWDGMGDDKTNGTILTLTFAIPAELPEGEYSVTLSYAPGAIYDASIENIDFVLENGKITVRSVDPGDIDGDGYVNAKDVTILRRALAGGYGLVVDQEAADFSHDGYTNAKDVTILRRALAGGYGITLN